MPRWGVVLEYQPSVWCMPLVFPRAQLSLSTPGLGQSADGSPPTETRSNLEQ